MDVITGVLEVGMERAGDLGGAAVGIVVVAGLDGAGAVGHFTHRTQVIPRVIVAGSTELFALGVEPFLHSVAGVAFLGDAAAEPDELLRAGDCAGGIVKERGLN